MMITSSPFFRRVPDRSLLHGLVRWGMAGVWLINGLWCKVLGQVPRHEAIAAQILGTDEAGLWIKLIGLSEIGMAGWVFSRIQPRLNAWTQIGIVSVMNILEFFLARDLLLFGGANSLIAAGFVAVVYWHGAMRRNRPPD